MKNYKDEPRKIGIELEFYGITPERAAELVKKEIGGSTEKVHNDLFKVKSAYGTFQIETDAELIKKLSEASEKNKNENKSDIDGVVVSAIKIISNEIVPSELVTPPLKIEDMSLVTDLQDVFLKEGAQGTTESFRFAFAAQLNPEVESLEVDYILNILKSFILLSDWLKSQIGMNITRKLTSFASDFPEAYCKKIFTADYSPSLEEFIDDYLEDNPTRNRGLDLLPLFAFIDRQKVDSVVGDERVKSRPTFHYRLPNSQIGLRSWNIEVEWSRWLVIEKLSKNKKLFSLVCRHYDDFINKREKTDWLQEMNNYVEVLRG